MKSEILLTIFTPVYNRANMLDNIYISLTGQTFKGGFEWVIVDDGSSDGIDEVIKKIKLNSDFPIKYVKQKNGGKHRAINKGVQLALGELFFIVDSDDYLTPDAVEFIYTEYDKIKNDRRYAGFAGLRAYSDGKAIVNYSFDALYLDCSILDFRYNKKIKGDLAEVFYTSILKKNPFPNIENEVFCSESLVWNRLGNQYLFRFINKPIYICEYLEGGLSDNSLRLRVENPNYARWNAFELSQYNISILEKIKASINFWRFTYHANKQKKMSLKPSLWCFLFFPLGWLLFLLDRFKLRKNS